jgi:acetyl-CoA carboxylase carboxyltransferase component
MPTMASEKIEALRRLKAHLHQGGGTGRIAKQHEKGKLTARERLAVLYDGDSFQEANLFIQHRCTHFGLQGQEFPGEGVITGQGLIDGRPAYAASQDFTVAAARSARRRPSTTPAARASRRRSTRSPATAKCSTATCWLSGVVPQIALICGPCAGGAAYSPALTDFIIMTRPPRADVHHRPRGHQGRHRRNRHRRWTRSAAPRCTPLSGNHFVAEDDAHAVQLRAAC